MWLEHHAHRRNQAWSSGAQGEIKNHLQPSLLRVMEEEENQAMFGIHKNSKQSTTTDILKNSPFEINDGSNHTYFLGGNSL